MLKATFGTGLAFSEKALGVSSGLVCLNLVCSGLHTVPPQQLAPLLLSSQADSRGCGCAAQTHQALTDETRSPQWQGTLEMSPSACLTVNTSSQSHPHAVRFSVLVALCVE